jgi:hypothetical protein
MTTIEDARNDDKIITNSTINNPADPNIDSITKEFEDMSIVNSTSPMMTRTFTNNGSNDACEPQKVKNLEQLLDILNIVRFSSDSPFEKNKNLGLSDYMQYL